MRSGEHKQENGHVWSCLGGVAAGLDINIPGQSGVTRSLQNGQAGLLAGALQNPF